MLAKLLGIILDIVFKRPNYRYSVNVIPKLESIRFDDDFNKQNGPLMFKIVFCNGDNYYTASENCPTICVGKYDFCLNNGCIANFNDIFLDFMYKRNISIATLNMLKTSMLDQLTDLLRNSEFDYFKGEYGKKLENMIRELNALV